MKDKKNIGKTALIIAVMVLVFIMGWLVGFNEHVSLVNEAKAEPKIETIKMTSGSVNYWKEYAYGHTFIVFYSNASGDIEVFPIN